LSGGSSWLTSSEEGDEINGRSFRESSSALETKEELDRTEVNIGAQSVKGKNLPKL
jgi:hypothetical protein